MDVYIGDIWRSKKGIERKVVDLLHEGYYPDDLDDMGSFEEFIVIYTDAGGKQHYCKDYEFDCWIQDEKAKLIFSPDVKVSYD
jgi:hypothetical protein